MLTDEQIEVIYNFIVNLANMDGEPSESMKQAIDESEDIAAHPEKYKSYSSFDDIMQERLR